MGPVPSASIAVLVRLLLGREKIPSHCSVLTSIFLDGTSVPSALQACGCRSQETPRPNHSSRLKSHETFIECQKYVLDSFRYVLWRSDGFRSMASSDRLCTNDAFDCDLLRNVFTQPHGVA
jgi:hypothetical protein